MTQDSRLLTPYLKLASNGDWYRPLSEYIRQRPKPELERVIKETEAQLEELGFILFNFQKELDSYYLRRISTLCKRRLQADSNSTLNSISQTSHIDG